MITRMQAILLMDTLAKKQCAALRGTLQDAYKIIAQGANDIMNVRHDVAEVQDEQRRRKQLACKKPCGQQLITDWLGQKRKRVPQTGDVARDINDCEYDEDEGHGNTWIPPTSLPMLDELRQQIQQAGSPDTIMASQGNTHVRARQLQCILEGGKVDSDIMGAFCRILDNGPKRRHCKIFKPGLYDALNAGGGPGRTARVGKSDANRYTQGIDIYQYEMLLVPIWIDKHWSSIAIDTAKKQIRYLDTIYEGGSEIFRRIKRWLREQWERFHTEPPPEWQTLPSTHGTTPRQHDDHSCEIFQLMFM